MRVSPCLNSRSTRERDVEMVIKGTRERCRDAKPAQEGRTTSLRAALILKKGGREGNYFECRGME